MDELKSHLPKAKFIAYMRNPMEIRESSYNQSVKRHYHADKINNRRIKRLPYLDRLVDYSNSFGEQDLYLRLYGEQYFKHGNIVSDLLSVMGIEEKVILPLINNSYQFEALEFKRWFNQFHLNDFQVVTDRALQGYSQGCGHYSLIPEDQYIADCKYYADVFGDYAKQLNSPNIAPLIDDMKKASAKPYFSQDISEAQFLKVCHYLQSVLGVDYYLMTREAASLTPESDKHFHDLFLQSCSNKYKYIYWLQKVRIKVGVGVRRLLSKRLGRFK
jgi:hypothetical protein